MESSHGLADPKKPLITSYSALKITILTVADTTFLTIMQKGKNRWNDLPPDITKMQVA